MEMAMRRHAGTAFPGPETITRHVLSNGITVLVLENHISPSVFVSGYLMAGSQDDVAAAPDAMSVNAEGYPGKMGLASFTVDVMERGTLHRSFDQLYEEVESIGASFGLSAGTHTTAFGAKGLAEHLPVLLDILRDVICTPAFDQRQVEKVRAEFLTDLQERRSSPRRMAALTFNTLAYPPAHPYHWSQVGYPGTIASIQREDLVAFHQSRITPENLVMVIVGDIQAEQAVASVSDYFSGWSQKPVQRRTLPAVPRLDRRKVKSVLVDDKVQTDIVLGWPGPHRLHPDFLPCFLGNTVLGVFGMYGRLGKRVREENSLAYFAYSSITGGLGPGPWRVNTGVDPDNIYAVLPLIQQEIRKLLDKPIPDDELDDSKAFLTGSLPLHLETNEGLAQAITNMERHQLGLDYLQQYVSIITTIHSREVREAMARWIHPEHCAVAIAGPTTYYE